MPVRSGDRCIYAVGRHESPRRSAIIRRKRSPVDHPGFFAKWGVTLMLRDAAPADGGAEHCGRNRLKQWNVSFDQRL